MSYNKVWYHTGAPCQGCTGIGDHWRQLDAAGVPFAVYSVEGGGLIAEAARYPGATLIYRMLETDVALYNLTPEQAALSYWNRMLTALPPEVAALKGRVWIEIGNEQDKARADWLGHYYVQLAHLADRDGHRLCGPGWSTGEPEPAHWETPGWISYLRMCAMRPDRLAVTLHEYSLDSGNIETGAPWLVGRFQFLFQACDKLNIARPTVFITETGWTHNDLPDAAKAREQIAWLAGLYAQHPQIKAAFLWTLIGGADKKMLAAELNALMPWLTQYSIETRFPDVEPPPTDPTDPPPTDPEPVANLLQNPSFEEGWTDSEQWPATQQNPKEWTLLWNLTSVSASGVTYQLGEGVHKNRLPPAEMGVLLWDGQWTYHVFAAHRPIYPRMKQFIKALPPGRYLLKTPVFVDCFHWNKELNRKEFAPFEPNHARFMVKVNEQIVRPWSNLQIGTRNQLETTIDHVGGDFDLAIHFSCEWAADTNGFFMDGWSLEKVEENQPVKHKAIVLKVPQDVTADEWQQAAAYGYQYRHTMTASHDDMLTVLHGGNEQSYVKLAYPDRQEDVAVLIEEAGYTWQPVLDEVAPPFPG